MKDTRDTCAQRRDLCGRGEEAAVCKPRREASELTSTLLTTLGHGLVASRIRRQ